MALKGIQTPALGVSSHTQILWIIKVYSGCDDLKIHIGSLGSSQRCNFTIFFRMSIWYQVLFSRNYAQLNNGKISRNDLPYSGLNMQRKGPVFLGLVKVFV